MDRIENRIEIRIEIILSYYMFNYYLFILFLSRYKYMYITFILDIIYSWWIFLRFFFLIFFFHFPPLLYNLTNLNFHISILLVIFQNRLAEVHHQWQLVVSCRLQEMLTGPRLHPHQQLPVAQDRRNSIGISLR